MRQAGAVFAGTAGGAAAAVAVIAVSWALRRSRALALGFLGGAAISALAPAV